MTWISAVSGPTKGRHEEVPKDIREEAERLAKKAMEGEDEEEEEKPEGEGAAAAPADGDRMEE